MASAKRVVDGVVSMVLLLMLEAWWLPPNLALMRKGGNHGEKKIGRRRFLLSSIVYSSLASYSRRARLPCRPRISDLCGKAKATPADENTTTADADV
uniref:Uncharacterized protein n=1 Tax=Oryza punctata TaxID=4537 RepID=A0A0E0L2H5_ORYPU